MTAGLAQTFIWLAAGLIAVGIVVVLVGLFMDRGPARRADAPRDPIQVILELIKIAFTKLFDPEVPRSTRISAFGMVLILLGILLLLVGIVPLLTGGGGTGSPTPTPTPSST